MKEYISTEFNVIHKDLKKFHRMSEAEAQKASSKENFKCFQFKHTYGDGVKTQIRMVDFKNGISFGNWSN